MLGCNIASFYQLPFLIRKQHNKPKDNTKGGKKNANYNLQLLAFFYLFMLFSTPLD